MQLNLPAEHQCEEAVGTNRLLMRYKWNSNVLQLPSAPLLLRFNGHAAPATGGHTSPDHPLPQDDM